MHELAIADSVVSIARRHARGRRVTRVDLRVGHMRQVVPSALTFAFELLTQDTELEHAELVIEDVPCAGTCRACGAATPLPDFPLACAACGSLDVEVTEGEELLVDSIDLEEPLSTNEFATNGGRSNG
jgi:hydrogenase nickel incorporation protein HypA/HybF